jgi:uncharacterized phage-associated protein
MKVVISGGLIWVFGLLYRGRRSWSPVERPGKFRIHRQRSRVGPAAELRGRRRAPKSYHQRTERRSPKRRQRRGGSDAAPIFRTSLAVANYFVVAFAFDKGVEHMKLQKLVYNAYGWWLAFHDAPFDEPPQVWKHGPVFNGLYHVLKPFGRNPIKTPQSASPFEAPPAIDGNDQEARQLLEWIWNRYGHLSSFALSNMTHKKGSPWQIVAKEHDFSVPFGLEILDDYIRREFRGIYNSEYRAAQRGAVPDAGQRAAEG